MDSADGQHNFLFNDRYELIVGKRDDRIVEHVSRLLHTAIAEYERGIDVLDTDDDTTRTFAAREYLWVLIDEYVISVLGAGAALRDTIGTPYHDLPEVLHDPEILAILARRDEARIRESSENPTF